MKSKSEERHIAEMTELGVANRSTLEKAQNWCKHLSVQMESAGMLAHMTGLPIGSHNVSCQHAVGGIGGMNLPWILPDFVAGHCKDCPHHAPNGDQSWGLEIIRDAQKAIAEAAERQLIADQRVEELRSRLSSLPRQAKPKADITERRILEWIEKLFSCADNESGAALLEAANVAPELFRAAAVNALVAGAAVEPFGTRCLPVLAALAPHRADMDSQLGGVARSAIFVGRCLEDACSILTEVAHRSGTQAEPEIVTKVIELRNHIRPIGGWPTKDPDCPLVDLPPNYFASNRFLILAFDQQPKLLLGRLRAGLADNEKLKRVNVCGVIESLIADRPQLGGLLVEDLLESLKLDDDIYWESADGAACALLAEIFRHDPIRLDQLIANGLQGQKDEIQELYVDVYRRVMSGRWRQSRRELPDSECNEERSAILHAFNRCLNLVHDDRIGLDARNSLLAGVGQVCRKYPDLAITSFESLLGMLATFHIRELPPDPPPRLLLPGEPVQPLELVAIEKRNRQMQWNQLKRSVLDCLEGLVQERPKQTLSTLCGSFNSLDSKIHAAFKADILKLVGLASQNAANRPAALPVLWKGLMDYDSVYVRAVAISAIVDAFQWAKVPPPNNVIEILLVHLNDSYVMVHLAVLRLGVEPQLAEPGSGGSSDQSCTSLGAHVSQK